MPTQDSQFQAVVWASVNWLGKSSAELRWQTNNPDTSVDIYTLKRPCEARSRWESAAKHVAGPNCIINTETVDGVYFRLEHPATRLGVVSAARFLPMDGTHNLRDLGGYPATPGKSTRWGRVFRSSHLSGLTQADFSLLRQQGLTLICDLRGISERDFSPSRLHERCGARLFEWDYDMVYGIFHLDTERISLDRDPRQSLIASMGRTYVDMLEQHTGRFRNMFNELLERDQTVLYHCSAGKDRTGLMTILLLSALGVSRDIILQDYMLSRYSAQQALSHMRAHAGHLDSGDEKAKLMKLLSMPKDLLNLALRGHPDMLTTFFAGVGNRYGSIERYLRNRLELDSRDLSRLQSLYLEDRIY